MGWLPWPMGRLDWVGVHAMALMGALDDRFNLRARYKALAGLAVAVLLAAHAASGLAQVADHLEFFDFRIPSHPLMTFPFLFVWLWSIPQAYNLIDGINGLSGTSTQPSRGAAAIRPRDSSIPPAKPTAARVQVGGTGSSKDDPDRWMEPRWRFGV
jgi:UDP-N-acetylmuramyl pentapeptide phosphotransferase/UDP-N-acetylglucosamine-1-phosphate transferase